MKKFICILFIFLIIFSNAVTCEEYDVYVKVNGSTVSSDVPPILKGGRTYLPLRAILNSIGVPDNNIIWWEMSNAVEIRHNDTHIFMVIDSNEAIVNDNIYYLDAPPFVTNGRTMVPVRFLSENLNCNVEWEEQTFTVNIFTN